MRKLVVALAALAVVGLAVPMSVPAEAAKTVIIKKGRHHHHHHADKIIIKKRGHHHD
jgi:Ni/Co efflux regulator RcnB